MVLSCACAQRRGGEQDGEPGRGRELRAFSMDIACSLPGFGVGFSTNFRLIQPENHPFVKEASRPISGKKRPWIHRVGWSMASPPVRRISPLKPTNFGPEGMLKVESVKPAKTSGGPRIAAQEDDAASFEPVGDARHRNFRAAGSRRRDGGRRRQCRGDRKAPRPHHRSRLSPAARALDLRHRHRRRRREIRADAAWPHADLERAELDAHVRGVAHRIQWRNLGPPRRCA